jgi:hypothetical protein
VLGHFALVHLLAIDDDVGWSSDTEPDLIAAEANHGDDDIATDSQGLVGTAAEDEHVFTPCQATGVPIVRQKDGLNRTGCQTVAVFDDANERRTASRLLQ